MQIVGDQRGRGNAVGTSLPLVQRGIDGRLTVLGGDYDQGRVIQALLLQFTYELADRSIDELEFIEQRRAGRGRGIEISTSDAVARFDQLLSYAYRLEVHTKHVRGPSQPSGAQASFAIDPVKDGVDLQRVIALDVLEAVCPSGGIGVWIKDGRAGDPGRRCDSGKSDDIGVDFRPIEVIERLGPDAGGNGGIGGVLVGPGCHSATLVNHAKDTVGADELP